MSSKSLGCALAHAAAEPRACRSWQLRVICLAIRHTRWKARLILLKIVARRSVQPVSFWSLRSAWRSIGAAVILVRIQVRPDASGEQWEARDTDQVLSGCVSPSTVAYQVARSTGPQLRTWEQGVHLVGKGCSAERHQKPAPRGAGMQPNCSRRSDTRCEGLRKSLGQDGQVAPQQGEARRDQAGNGEPVDSTCRGRPRRTGTHDLSKAV